MIAEPFVPNCITLAFRMLSAVDFNDEPALATDKISNVRPYRFLAHELETI